MIRTQKMDATATSLVTYSFVAPQVVSAAAESSIGDLVALPDEPFVSQEFDPKNFVRRFAVSKDMVNRENYAKFADRARGTVFLFDSQAGRVVGSGQNPVELIFDVITPDSHAAYGHVAAKVLADLQMVFQTNASEALTRMIRTRKVLPSGPQFTLFQVGGYWQNWDVDGNKPAQVSFLEAAAYAFDIDDAGIPTAAKMKYAVEQASSLLSLPEGEDAEWTFDTANAIFNGAQKAFRLLSLEDPLRSLNLLPFSIEFPVFFPARLTLNNIFAGYNATLFGNVAIVSKQWDGVTELASRLGLKNGIPMPLR